MGKIYVLPPRSFWSQANVEPRRRHQRAIWFIAALPHPPVPEEKPDGTGVFALPKILVIRTFPKLVHFDSSEVRVMGIRINPRPDFVIVDRVELGWG